MTTRPPDSRTPPSAPADERPPFVLGGLLLPLLDAGYEDDAREVVELYLEDHQVKLEEIQEALEAGDLDLCGQAAHLLIGSAGGIGAGDLAVALTSFEEACRAGDLPKVRAELETVLSEERRVLQTAREFVQAGKN